MLCTQNFELFSWSHVTYTIRELTVTPLEEGCREEEEEREGYVRRLLRLSVAEQNVRASDIVWNI